MMFDETDNVTRKTWSRNIEPVIKIGYMDGAADGQTAAFQSSFDMGYKQGYSFGLELGLQNALKSLQPQEDSSNQELQLRDPRKINCQICMNGIPSEQNVVNLYNTQQENNNELLKEKDQLENNS